MLKQQPTRQEKNISIITQLKQGKANSDILRQYGSVAKIFLEQAGSYFGRVYAASPKNCSKID